MIIRASMITGLLELFAGELLELRLLGLLVIRAIRIIGVISYKGYYDY